MAALLNRREWIAMGVAVAATPATGAGLPARTRLSLNENAWGPSPTVAPAIRAAALGVERYVEPAEVDALTRQIATLEGVAPEQVVIGEVLEALGLFLARRRPGGGEIVFSAPGYTALIDAAAPLGGRGRPVPLDARLENDLPALSRAVGEDTLAVSLVNPHNPSGTVTETEAWHAFLVEVSRRTLAVVDEAYLEYDDLAGLSAIRHVRDGRDVLVFRTLAKIYGLAGLSIGYAVAQAPLAAALRQAGIGAPHSLSRPALVAASAALGDQAHVATVRNRTASERRRLQAALDALSLRYTDARGNFVFFRTPEAARIRAAAAAAGIEIARPFAPLDDWVRVTIGLPVENDRFLAVLRTVVG
ncbi:pyridoxal phosphate-dependent aminotransferase [Sphingomonas sp. RIT328]|uniref:pyridoxal phosphate-dependent aminotransferase n=1 Tax=Sphingomonas sp. RIT328 TaxID=1470591 RepID=UPI000451D0A0|nr:histidinol-phosphate transaminase [Sphingomonas sp. RIT328]EZP51337.1 Class I and II aminotransferase [Sphingomonas sp. RIT328]